MNIIVIAPHPDDESIGCGGTVCKRAKAGDRVTAVYLTSGELALKKLAREQAWRTREKEARAAAQIRGLADLIFLRGPDWYVADTMERLALELRGIFAREMPGLIYLPHPGEWHPDHKAALPLVRATLAQSEIAQPTLRTYEVWTPLSDFNHVEDISSVMPIKLRAVRAHRSQCKDLRYDRAIRGLNEYRGAMAARCRYAEVFQTMGPDVPAQTKTGRCFNSTFVNGKKAPALRPRDLLKCV